MYWYLYWYEKSRLALIRKDKSLDLKLMCVGSSQSDVQPKHDWWPSPARGQFFSSVNEDDDENGFACYII